MSSVDFYWVPYGFVLVVQLFLFSIIFKQSKYSFELHSTRLFSMINIELRSLVSMTLFCCACFHRQVRKVQLWEAHLYQHTASHLKLPPLWTVLPLSPHVRQSTGFSFRSAKAVAALYYHWPLNRHIITLGRLSISDLYIEVVSIVIVRVSTEAGEAVNRLGCYLRFPCGFRIILALGLVFEATNGTYDISQ